MDNNQSNEVVLQLLPKPDDILKFQVTNQSLLVKPHVVETIKTQSGIILDGGVETDMIKRSLLQVGTVIVAGKNCSEVQVGMEVYYYKSSAEGMVRDDDGIYLIIQEYNIKAYITK